LVPLLESGKAEGHQVEIGFAGVETRGWKVALSNADIFWHDFIPCMIYTQTNGKKLRAAQAYSLRSRVDENEACALA
jgi:hypothetical protein